MKDDGNKILRVEIDGLLLCPIDCPVCGANVVVVNDDFVEYNPCEHVLFIATDNGFIHALHSISRKYEEVFNTEDDAFEDENIDSFTDGLSIDCAIKIATYDDPPSMLGFYIGFDLGKALSANINKIVASIEKKRDDYFDSILGEY